MSRIYKTSDRIEIKVDDISIFISPLSYHQKMALQSEMIKAANGNMDAAMNAVVKSLKMSLKDIKGLTTLDENGNDVEYKLAFTGEELSDDTVNDLLNLPCSQKLTAICTGLLGGVPDKIMGPDGNPLEGVSVIAPKVTKPKKP